MTQQQTDGIIRALAGMVAKQLCQLNDIDEVMAFLDGLAVLFPNHLELVDEDLVGRTDFGTEVLETAEQLFNDLTNKELRLRRWRSEQTTST